LPWSLSWRVSASALTTVPDSLGLAAELSSSASHSVGLYNSSASIAASLAFPS